MSSYEFIKKSVTPRHDLARNHNGFACTAISVSTGCFSVRYTTMKLNNSWTPKPIRTRRHFLEILMPKTFFGDHTFHQPGSFRDMDTKRKSHEFNIVFNGLWHAHKCKFINFGRLYLRNCWSQRHTSYYSRIKRSIMHNGSHQKNCKALMRYGSSLITIRREEIFGICSCIICVLKLASHQDASLVFNCNVIDQSQKRISENGCNQSYCCKEDFWLVTRRLIKLNGSSEANLSSWYSLKSSPLNLLQL